MKSTLIYLSFAGLIAFGTAQSEVPTTPYQVMTLFGYEDSGIEEGDLYFCEEASLVCIATVGGVPTGLKATLGFENNLWTSVDRDGKAEHSMVNESLTITLTELDGANTIIFATSNVE